MGHHFDLTKRRIAKKVKEIYVFGGFGTELSLNGDEKRANRILLTLANCLEDSDSSRNFFEMILFLCEKYPDKMEKVAKTLEDIYSGQIFENTDLFTDISE